jgi:hypothetical protein
MTMSSNNQAKHQKPLPNARQIRRSCSKELYRTIKKLKTYIPPDRLKAAEDLYFRKVVFNLIWISENGSNRRLLSDWWEENVCGEIAELWNVEQNVLARAFRDSFGG